MPTDTLASIGEVFAWLRDLEGLVRAVGYVGIFAIVFTETGLFFGFFLPGDSLLVTAGLVAQQGQLDIVTLLVVLSVAAIGGDAAGYWIGRRAGPRLFQRENSRLFKRGHLLAAEAFYRKHGGKTIVLARFVPFVRTFAPAVAGAAGMPYGAFTLYNVAGGLAWVFSTTLVGYYLGALVPNLDVYLLPLIALVVLVSMLPAIIHVWRERRASARR